MKWLAIINPRSGHRKDEEHIHALRVLLASRLGDSVETIETEHMGHALVLARRRDVDGFIAVGGDGTVFDIVNGMDLDRQVLGLLPAGTGNGLARELAIAGVEEALERIVAGARRQLDLVAVRLRLRGGEESVYRCTSTCSIGYVTDVVELANVSLKVFGPFCYPLAAAVQSLLMKPFSGRWRIDEGSWGPLDATNLIVNNTKYAGDFRVFPDAVAWDGRADMIIANIGALKQFAHNLSIITKSYWYSAGECKQVSSVEVELDDERMVQLDGEIVSGVVSLAIEVEPRRLHFAA